MSPTISCPLVFVPPHTRFRAQALGPRESRRPSTFLKSWRSRHRSALPLFPHLHSLPASVCGPICPLVANVPRANSTRTHALPGTGIDPITSTSSPGGLGNASPFSMTEGRDCGSSRRSARIGFPQHHETRNTSAGRWAARRLLVDWRGHHPPRDCLGHPSPFDINPVPLIIHLCV
jgi:hypothetical protein